MKNSTDPIDALNRQLSQVSAPLSTPPGLDRIELRIQQLRRTAKIQVGFGAACFAALIGVAFAFGLREGGFMFLCGIVESVLGLTTLLCISERRMGQVSDEAFLIATRGDSTLARVCLIVTASVMGTIYAVSVILGPVGALDAVLAAFHWIVVAYQVWMIRHERKSPAIPALRSPKL